MMCERACQTMLSYIEIEKWHQAQKDSEQGEIDVDESDAEQGAQPTPAPTPAPADISKLITPKLLEDRFFNPLISRFSKDDTRPELKQFALKHKGVSGKDARLAALNDFRILTELKYPDIHKEYDFPKTVHIDSKAALQPMHGRSVRQGAGA